MFNTLKSSNTNASTRKAEKLLELTSSDFRKENRFVTINIDMKLRLKSARGSRLNMNAMQRVPAP
ncbi:hypothetical protein PPTG_24551 [Phytophthora nicotianae INRA-310]|uniref:Uncharacterized protein n=1 Tax=Phytophthora nicotianae (strain INRA-310) TaxID=761204 RepID=W2PF00_PHYN3|nr:hypothetical protein PPTG_24551 [Phytophthora nicotianae INRA-310]ETM98768.1 hypothetical protein PPTG_24551 [Phytophthora nicotianae INRA-310]